MDNLKKVLKYVLIVILAIIAGIIGLFSWFKVIIENDNNEAIERGNNNYTINN